MKEGENVNCDYGKLEVEIVSDGITSSVKLNGIEFSKCIGSVTYQHEGSDVPKLTLELYPESVKIKSLVGLAALKEKMATPELGATK